MWNPFQPVNRIEQYTPIFSDDSYENDIEQETALARAWGEDDDEFDFDDLLEDLEDEFSVDDDDYSFEDRIQQSRRERWDVDLAKHRYYSKGVENEFSVDGDSDENLDSGDDWNDFDLDDLD